MVHSDDLNFLRLFQLHHPHALYGGMLLIISFLLILMQACSPATTESKEKEIRISVVNAPSDIVTIGANYIGNEISERSNSTMKTRVFHSGVLSGGKGEAEIEMCQQGTIEMHITSTAYLANLVPRTSIVSLPFLFRDIDQVTALVKSQSRILTTINEELNTKNLHILAWWPRGFRQLTNSKLPVQSIDDLRGLKLRVMNNPLYTDNMRAMLANPVPMAWGEVYNGLQLKTIDGQENAEDVIYNSRLYEAQKFMTIWDYSIDLEVVLVNLKWWSSLRQDQQDMISAIARESVSLEEELLRKNTILLRKKIADEGMAIHYLTPGEKAVFREAVTPVWSKYETIFGKSFLDSFLIELEELKPL
jgi:TRAP-type transport system periplasmic protein